MPNNVTVQYEDTVNLSIEKASNTCIQWLEGQHKAKITKKSKPPNLIIAKQGTMMANSGFDPNWKKNIRINLFDTGENQTLVRVEARILSRNIRTSHIEKLKNRWWEGLFKNLYSLLVKIEGGKKEKKVEAQPTFAPEEQVEIKAQFCPGCGKKIDEKVKYCPACGVEIED